MRTLSRSFKFLCILVLAMTMQKAEAGPGNEILWDDYGVPHIYGQSLGQMYFEFGWAQMHNHANLILRLYGQARGRAAEYWGEKFLASDKQERLFRVPAMAIKQYAQQEPEFKGLLDAFVRGMNSYVAAHPESVDAENRQVLPVSATDVLAHGIRVIFLRFVAGEDLGVANRRTKAGSNSYAVGPARSASGAALLLANPHLPWSDLYTFFEAHLQAPGFNAYGVAIVGLPVLNIAFNEHLGWTHTVNPIDACDRYELAVRGRSYMLDSVLVPFDTDTVSLKVRQPDGSLKEQSVEFRYARQGPVLEAGDQSYAIRIAGFGNPGILYQWHRMAAAGDWRQFEQALKRMQLPMFNVVYADKKGNIFYLFAGNVPRRPGGDWNYWKGAIDGTHSSNIWQDVLSYDELPKLFNPPTGFIQNANDPPWTCTYPAMLDHRHYPGYLSPRMMALRPQRAVHMIRKDSGITLDKLAGYKLNTGMEAADRFLDELLADVQQYPDSLSRLAAAVLKSWDRKTDAGSRGAILFARWFDKLQRDMFTRPWQEEDPVGTPSGLRNPGEAVGLLALAAKEVIRDFDSLNVAWGDVFRFRQGKLDYPANGGSDQYGIYRSIYYIQDADKKYRAVAGDSYVAVTEFGREIKARVLLSYGNASQSGNKHAGDQLPLLSQKRLRNALLKRQDILNNLEEKNSFP